MPIMTEAEAAALDEELTRTTPAVNPNVRGVTAVSSETRKNMNGAKTLSPERIAEIKAFKNTNFTDCPVMTDEELKRLRPRHPEYFKPVKKAIQIRLDADILAWFKGFGKGYQSRINAVLREVMLQNTQS